MKRLYIIRHAKSSWANNQLSDFDRPLNDRGNRDAPIIGEVLKNKKVKPDLVISSSAKRALTTAKILSDIIGYPIENIEESYEIYETTTQNLLDVVNDIDDINNSVILFGHNPGFTRLANLLGDKYIENLPTCAVAEIELDVDSWEDVGIDSGKLVSFEYPKKYNK